MTHLQSILEKHFQLPTFRRGQQEVIEAVLGGRDAMAVMPTGGGKSLCYQLPALCRPGVVVVISPLIALMEDQVAALNRLGIPAGAIHSGLDIAARREVFSRMKSSQSFILYLSPERVQKSGFADWVRTQPISLFAIDESHCISQWGADFRKDYDRLSLLRELRSDVPILALTATATPRVLKDISKSLGLREPERHVYGFYRPNLFCQVEFCDSDADKSEKLRTAVALHTEGRVLIYCGTRKQTEALAEALGQEFGEVGYYHAGLDSEERARVQGEYYNGTIRILTATNAFGMGIDHPDVRLVVHAQMPANLESYYQEIGRAGRDGKPSNCLLLYSPGDRGLHEFFIRNAEIPTAVAAHRRKALSTMVDFAEGAGCRHAEILTYFRDNMRLGTCGHCDICAPDSPRKVPTPEVLVSPTPSTAAVLSVTKRKKGSRKQNTESVGATLTPYQQLQYEILSAWRREYADQHDIPAFIVFSNRTLDELVRRNPTTEDELHEVHGFGPQKVSRLGAMVLERLQSATLPGG